MSLHRSRPLVPGRPAGKVDADGTRYISDGYKLKVADDEEGQDGIEKRRKKRIEDIDGRAPAQTKQRPSTLGQNPQGSMPVVA